MRWVAAGTALLIVGSLLGCEPNHTCPIDDAEPRAWVYLWPCENPPHVGDLGAEQVPYEGCWRRCDPAQPGCPASYVCEHRWWSASYPDVDPEDTIACAGMWICVAPGD